MVLAFETCGTKRPVTVSAAISAREVSYPSRVQELLLGSSGVTAGEADLRGSKTRSLF
jgi:hypothetical protein